MQPNTSSFSSSGHLEIAYTDKPVSGWGGLVAMMRFFEKVGLRACLQHALPDGRTSNNQVAVVDMMVVLMATVLTGGRRFDHVERLRADEVVKKILGVARMASAGTLRRYLSGFIRSQVEHLTEVLWRLVVPHLPSTKLGAVLDLDSTVFERYGKQEGSLKGHNPRKHGRPSHHPILAMLAEAKIILHAWLRSGNAGTARGVKAFLAESLARLPQGFRLYAVRADSGFFVSEFLDDLEERGLPYAIAVRMTRPIQRLLFGIREWTRFGAGLDVAEFQYQALGWKRPRRLVVIREELRERPDAKGRKLIDLPGYTFHAVVTTLPLPAPDAWRFYNGRADSENRLKELKESFGAGGFCLHSFDGTEACFRFICFVFNLVAIFKREVLHDESPTLDTVRNTTLVVGAILGQEGRNPVLRLGLKGVFRQRFDTLLARIARWIHPTAGQSGNYAESQLDYRPPPWKPRDYYRSYRGLRRAARATQRAYSAEAASAAKAGSAASQSSISRA
jgi:hypothetical protein